MDTNTTKDGLGSSGKSAARSRPKSPTKKRGTVSKAKIKIGHVTKVWGPGEDAASSSDLDFYVAVDVGVGGKKHTVGVGVGVPEYLHGQARASQGGTIRSTTTAWWVDASDWQDVQGMQDKVLVALQDQAHRLVREAEDMLDGKAPKRANKKSASKKKARKQLVGREAIEYVRAHGGYLSKYADPTEGARFGLSISEAELIAKEDPSLIYFYEGSALEPEAPSKKNAPKKRETTMPKKSATKKKSTSKKPASKKKKAAPKRAKVAKNRCARKGKIGSKSRKLLPSNAFALPKVRMYPLYKLGGDGKLVPSGSHATNAKARARGALSKGTITRKQYEMIVRKANTVLGRCGHAVRKATSKAKSSTRKKVKRELSRHAQRQILNQVVKEISGV